MRRATLADSLRPIQGCKNQRVFSYQSSRTPIPRARRLSVGPIRCSNEREGSWTALTAPLVSSTFRCALECSSFSSCAGMEGLDKEDSSAANRRCFTDDSRVCLSDALLIATARFNALMKARRSLILFAPEKWRTMTRSDPTTRITCQFKQTATLSPGRLVRT